MKFAVTPAPKADDPPNPDVVFTIRAGDNGTYSPIAASVAARAGDADRTDTTTNADTNNDKHDSSATGTTPRRRPQLAA